MGVCLRPLSFLTLPQGLSSLSSLANSAGSRNTEASTVGNRLVILRLYCLMPCQFDFLKKILGLERGVSG